MKTFWIILLSLYSTCIIRAQESNYFINRTMLGYNEFNANSPNIFKTTGVSLSNETIFNFNKYVNPGLRISVNTGSNIDSDIIMFNNTLSLNGYVKELSLKKHHLQLGGGISWMISFYNYHLNNTNTSIPNTTGYYTFGYNWQIKYLFSITKIWDVGIEFSQIYTKYDMKISSLTLVTGFNFKKY